MHILTFTVGGQPYAIPSRTVLEVLPLVPARPVPLLPDYCPGVFTYRGRLVPLVDLGRRFGVAGGGAGGHHRLSTRVIVVEFPLEPASAASADPAAVPAARLGLVADDVVSIQAADVAPDAALSAGQAPFLGRLVRLPLGTVQLVVVERLVPPDVLTGLVSASGAGP